jgi:hypothetical protein
MKRWGYDVLELESRNANRAEANNAQRFNEARCLEYAACYRRAALREARPRMRAAFLLRAEAFEARALELACLVGATEEGRGANG